MPSRYFEDLHDGETVTCRPFSLSLEQIVSFGREYDPQPFHVDEAAGAESIFGGIVASGVQTLACCTRVVVDATADVAVLGGLGMDEVHTRNPVRPDDEIRVTGRWEGLRRSASNPTRGLGLLRCQALNQRGEVVIEYAYRYIVACRDTASE